MTEPTNKSEDVDLSAAIGESAKENFKISPALSLAGVILLSGLAAGALIYFRRQKTVDSEGLDD